MTGDTPDISEWLDFEFYDLVWWIDRPNKPDITDMARRLGRWLGVSHRVGSDLCYWVATDSGQLVSKTSVEHVTQEDYLQADIRKQIDEFNQKLEDRLDDANFRLNIDEEADLSFLEDIEIDDSGGATTEHGVAPDDEEYGDMLRGERPEDDDEEAIDRYLNMELIMDVGTSGERRGRVIK